MVIAGVLAREFSGFCAWLQCELPEYNGCCVNAISLLFYTVDGHGVTVIEGRLQALSGDP